MDFPFPKPKSERQAVLFTILSIVIVSFILHFVAAYVLHYLDGVNLIDWNLIVSLVIAEVPISVFLYYILGEHRRSATQRMHDAIAKVHALSEFNHLAVVFSDFWEMYDYPRLRYYVINLDTKLAFYAPDYIHDLHELGVIRGGLIGIEQEKLDEFFKKNEITLVKRLPFIVELDSLDVLSSKENINAIIEDMKKTFKEFQEQTEEKKEQEKKR